MQTKGLCLSMEHHVAILANIEHEVPRYHRVILGDNGAAVRVEGVRGVLRVGGFHPAIRVG
jgi:hypothetical protein